MSDVLISFVVPAYNEEVLIASCLASIRRRLRVPVAGPK